MSMFKQIIPAVLAALSLALGAATAADAAASVQSCAPVTFKGVLDFRLVHINAIEVSCKTARRVVRGARLQTHWHSLGFNCKVTHYELEVRTYFRCTKGSHQAIIFHTA